MQKLIFVGSRNPEMSREEYRRYVSEIHGPLVVKTPDVVAPILRYIQHYPLYEVKDRAFGIPIRVSVDGVIEMLMESVPAMVTSLQSQQYNDIIKPDEERMADKSSVMMHFVKEMEVIPGASGKIKLYHFLKRQLGLTRQEFQDRWSEEQVSLLTHKNDKGKLMSYLQNHVLPASTFPFGVADGGIDIIDEYTFDSEQAMSDFLSEDKLAVNITENIEELTDWELSFAVIVDWKVYVNRE